MLGAFGAMVGSQGEKFDAENVQETGKEITLEDGKQNKAKKMVKLEPGGWFGG